MVQTGRWFQFSAIQLYIEFYFFKSILTSIKKRYSSFINVFMINSLVILFLVLLSASSCSQTLTVNATNEGVWVYEKGKKVLFYQAKTKSKDGKYGRANYVHPLYGIDGAELTEDFPEDHLHHRGIFWAWHQVMIGDEQIGDAWECRDFEWEVAKSDYQWEDDLQLSLLIKTFWKSPQWRNASGVQEPFLEENTKITIHPTVKDYRIIDFEISLLALVPELKIGGSDDEKGYGGFSVRMKTPEDISFTSPEGEITPKTGPVHAGAWMDISGSIGTNGNNAGVMIISNPQNPSYPEPWILRKKESMQNIVYPGRAPVPVSDKVPTILRYRLLVYKGHKSEYRP